MSKVLADSMASSSWVERRSAASHAILTSIVSRSSQISSTSSALSSTQALQQRLSVSQSLTLDPPCAPLLVTMQTVRCPTPQATLLPRLS